MLTKTPTGRIPGIVMRFKIDDNLMRIARAKDEAPETTAIELCKACVEAGYLYDSTDYYGFRNETLMADAEISVKSAGDILARYLGVVEIKSELFDAFCGLIVVGDGNCPRCGGNLELYDSDVQKIPSSSYDIPPEYKVTTIYYECPVCGIKIKSEKEL